jgi:hypothetical protein
MINTIHGFNRLMCVKKTARHNYRLIYDSPISRVNLKTGVITNRLIDGTYKHRMFIKETDVRFMVTILENDYTSLLTHQNNLTRMTAAERLVCTLLDLTFKEKR